MASSAAKDSRYVHLVPSRKPRIAKGLEVDGIFVEIVRKRVKHVNLRVYPPDGRVRVSAPIGMPDRAVAQAVRGRLSWLRRQRARFAAVPVPPRLEYLSGEKVSVLGTQHTLRYVTGRTQAGPLFAAGTGAADGRTAGCELRLVVTCHAGVDERRRALEDRLRKLARAEFCEEVARWAPVMGLPTPKVNVRSMRSRWGTCHVRAGRIYLNLALVTRPRECLTYVVVHELAHLSVPDHSPAFWRTVERYLPSWRHAQKKLADEPLWADPVWARERLLSPDA